MIRVGLVGTGPDPGRQTTESYAMGYVHADAFAAIDGVGVVACADIVPANAAAFADTYGLDDRNVFENYDRMVQAVDLDVVSVTVPPDVHERVVVDIAESGRVGAIHCEKPMAMSWTAAKGMVATAAANDVALTINHQRRFADPFIRAKELLDGGAIGDLESIVVTWGDLYDTGSHVVDLAGFFTNEADPKWAIAQIDYREEDVRFGVHTENQALAQWCYDSGVVGLLSTGPGKALSNAKFTLAGTEGRIQVDVDSGPTLRVDRGNGNWEIVETDGGIHGRTLHHRAIADVVRAYREGESSQLRAENAIKSTAVFFGAYESVRRRARVTLPPSGVDDHPLQTMVEAGTIVPERSVDERRK